MEIPMRIDSFGDSKTDNFFRGDEDGGKNIPRRKFGDENEILFAALQKLCPRTLY
jgi:hypothetical protein